MGSLDGQWVVFTFGPSASDVEVMGPFPDWQTAVNVAYETELATGTDCRAAQLIPPGTKGFGL